jgi:hypothetical protein
MQFGATSVQRGHDNKSPDIDMAQKLKTEIMIGKTLGIGE